jgi:hypothetical protein
MRATIVGLGAMTVLALAAATISGLGVVSSIRSMSRFSGVIHGYSALAAAGLIVLTQGVIGVALVVRGWRVGVLARRHGLPERLEAIAARNVTRWLIPNVAGLVPLGWGWVLGVWASGRGTGAVPVGHVFAASLAAGFQVVALLAGGIATSSQRRLIGQVRARIGRGVGEVAVPAPEFGFSGEGRTR